MYVAGTMRRPPHYRARTHYVRDVKSPTKETFLQKVKRNQTVWNTRHSLIFKSTNECQNDDEAGKKGRFRRGMINRYWTVYGEMITEIFYANIV